MYVSSVVLKVRRSCGVDPSIVRTVVLVKMGAKGLGEEAMLYEFAESLVIIQLHITAEPLADELYVVSEG